jgi:hypothetical protein
MSAPYGCFEYVIGLSRTDCPCTDSGKPTDAGESASGYYLDEAPGLNLQQVKNAAICPEFWDWMEKARQLAVQDYQADVLSCIRSNTEYARNPLKSIIGDASDSIKLLTMNKPYHGLTVQTAHVVGGTMTVKRIGLKVDTTGPIDIEVYSRDGPLVTYTVDAVEDVLTWYTLPADLELDMDAEGSENPRYWFLWQPSGEKAYNTRLHCGCISNYWKPYWDLGHPYYESRVEKGGFAWADWAMAAGTKGDTLADRDTWATLNETQGVMLDVRFNCDANTTICTDDPDYTDPLQRDQARAIQMRAAWYLMKLIRSSSNPSFWTLLNLEEIHALMLEYDDQYKGRVGALCEEFSKSENINLYGDCLKCKDHWGFAVKTIRT